MASTSEIGHARNLANLQKLLDLITQIGPDYNPSNAQITSAGLLSLQANCTTTFNDYVAKEITWKNNTNNREIQFKALPQLCAQILDNIKTLSLPAQTIKDVESIIHTIKGHSAKTKKTSPATGTPTSGGTSNPATNTINPPPATGRSIGTPVSVPNPTITPIGSSISTSHRSYDNMLANFYKLVQLIQTISTYNPNETNIKVAALQTTYTSLSTLNNAAINSINALALARNQRNISFYADDTGMVDLTKKVKKYIRQLEGATSDIYHKAIAIKFVKIISKKKKK